MLVAWTQLWGEGHAKYGVVKPKLYQCSLLDPKNHATVESEFMHKLNHVRPLYASPSAESDSKPLKDIFQRVVVVNLDKRTDRLGHFVKELEKGWPFLDPLRFSAIHGDKCGWPRTWGHGPNTYGCMESHRQILQRAILDDIESILVLEDDLVLCDNFTQKAQEFFNHVPKDWDWVCIGGQHLSQPADIGNNIVKCTNTQRTHAYGLRGKVIKEAYIHIISSEGHVDHRYGDIQSKYNVYAPKPFICGQMQDQSDISGSRNPLKFWADPSFEKHIVVLLHAPKDILPKLREEGFHMGFSRDHGTDIDVGLRDIYSGGVTQQKLKDFLVMLIWESESMQLAGKKSYVTIWHPDAKDEEIKSSSPCKYVEVSGNTVEEVLADFKGKNA